MPDLVVDNVSKQFPTRAESLVVLRGVSLELSRGQNLAILGPSGSGKSTLLQIIGTLLRLRVGRLASAGRTRLAWTKRGWPTFGIGDLASCFRIITCCRNVRFWKTCCCRRSRKDGRIRPLSSARSLIDRVGLSERLDHRPAELSGGERQRVAVARALVLRPTLLLADEPTGNLDHSTATGVGQLLLDLQREEQTMLIVVTHSLELASHFERRVALDGGNLVSKS